jgi:dihydroneopterin aldolase
VSEDVLVELRDLRAYGPHGVTAAEREVGCWIALDIRLLVEGCGAVESDDVAETVDYGKVAALATSLVRERSCNTLERLGATIADAIEERFGVRELRIRIAKPDPPIDEPIGDVAVTIERPSR